MSQTYAPSTRIDRSRYWRWSSVGLGAGAAGLWAVIATVNQTSQPPVDIGATIAAIAGILVFAAAAIALVVIGIWRLHDRGRSGVWIIPYYAAPCALALAGLDPDGQRDMLAVAAVLILAGALTDLGLLKGAPVAV
jgi:uncharacterized membrane protein YhaH (DUF805 family)